jgi:hypothetical protein
MLCEWHRVVQVVTVVLSVTSGLGPQAKAVYVIVLQWTANDVK